ncbi:hypothetical protein [Treponema sp. R6D11]
MSNKEMMKKTANASLSTALLGDMIALSKFSENCCVPRYDRSANGELKLTSFGSSWKSLSALGCLGFIHPHALNGVHKIKHNRHPPRPPTQPTPNQNT